MSCMLRFAGKDFDADVFAARFPAGNYDCKVSRKGENRFKTRPEEGIREYGAVSIVVSEADMDSFEQQKKDTMSFFEKNENLFAVLNEFDVELKVLDFGVYSRIPNGFTHSEFFPPEIIALCAKYNIGIELSHYLPAEQTR
ncbi:hypothetical protein ACTHGU_06400 [Chitinophagaceae bacterium MMS25-I14]